MDVFQTLFGDITFDIVEIIFLIEVILIMQRGERNRSGIYIVKVKLDRKILKLVLIMGKQINSVTLVSCGLVPMVLVIIPKSLTNPGDSSGRPTYELYPGKYRGTSSESMTLG